MKLKIHFGDDLRSNQQPVWIKHQSLSSGAMPDPLAFPVWLQSRLHGIISNLNGIVRVPIAYQDEMGFHFGEEPPGQTDEQPPGT